MSELFSRRSLFAFAAAGVWAPSALAASDRLAALEATSGGRLGVAALDVASGASLAHRDDERFPMCSTFKAMAVAALLARIDRGAERLDRFIPIGEADLLDYAPVTRMARLKAGGMALGDLCAAAIQISDNTAANLILSAIGGPAGWTGFVRSLADAASRLDRTEPALNAVVPGDPRDTTTPLAMLRDLQLTTLGKVLSPGSRDRLVDWMVGCRTGAARLRAGLPAAWRIADKTGTGPGTTGDIAVAWTAGGPIVVASYLSGAAADLGVNGVALVLRGGRIVAAAFRPHG
jgi:beta-lactamase class A